MDTADHLVGKAPWGKDQERRWRGKVDFRCRGLARRETTILVVQPRLGLVIDKIPNSF